MHLPPPAHDCAFTSQTIFLVTFHSIHHVPRRKIPLKWWSLLPVVGIKREIPSIFWRELRSTPARRNSCGHFRVPRYEFSHPRANEAGKRLCLFEEWLPDFCPLYLYRPTETDRVHASTFKTRSFEKWERERERVVRREVNGNDNGNPELGIIRYNEPLRMMHGLSILVVFRSN